MQSVLAPVFDMAASRTWLVTANFILSVLLCLWMLRYRRLYFAARVEKQHVSDLIENLTEGIYRSTPDGRQISANKALVKLNGYDSEAEMLSSVGDIAKEWYVDPRRRDEFRERLMRDGQISDFVSEIYRHKSRERIWISESARVVRDPDSGEPLFYEGSVREVTETIQRLRIEERFQKLTSEVPGALFQLLMQPNQPTQVVYLSPGFTRMTGISHDDIVATPQQILLHIHQEDRRTYLTSLADALESMSPWDNEHRFRTSDGVEKWFRVSATPQRNGNSVMWYGYMSDVSARKLDEVAIQQLAYYDALTGLPNRRLFLDRMAAAVRGCNARNDFSALLFIDLDNFKTLNDTQGHDVGDEYLVQVAQRLQRCVGQKDTVSRIGGDEFVVVGEALGDSRPAATARAISIANRIVGALREPFELGHIHYRSTASVGIVVFDGCEVKADELLKHADIAMYEAKTAGRDGIALFDPVSMSVESERLQLVAELRSAIATAPEQLVLHYQPQVDSSGTVIAAEALVRWDHPQRGLLPPDNFIPLAEQFGMIGDIGRIVLERAAATLAEWRDLPETAPLRLSVNASVQQFYGDEFVAFLRSLLKRTGVDGESMTIEVTESVMARDQRLIARRMRDLKALGVRLSLDDFGSGRSSLAHVKEFPFDEVKIDGGFIADLETAENDRALTRTILAMARMLKLTAVAEHVENAKQEAFLRAYGCDCLQGYYYSEPLPPEEFLDYMRVHRSKVIQLDSMRQQA